MLISESMLEPSTSASFHAGSRKATRGVIVAAFGIVVPDTVKADRQELGEAGQCRHHAQQDAKQTKDDQNIPHHRRPAPTAFAGDGPRNAFMVERIAQ